MATMRGMKVLLCIVAALSCWAASVQAQSYAVTTWTSGAHATFYGGTDASGTMGGACGYGNLYTQGYGTNTAALSDVLFNDGLSCGACFALQCDTAQTTWCYGGNTLFVTATNNCPLGSFGTWCDAPKVHFDLAFPAFTQLAQSVGGVIPIQYMRVPCQRTGGVRFTIDGSPYYISILPTNVAGAGDVQALGIVGSNNATTALDHNWGQVWTLQSQLVGQAITFQCTVGDNGFAQTLQFWNAIPSSWDFGQTYEMPYNFNTLQL